MGGWGPRQPPAACQTPGLRKGTPLFETQPADSAGAAPCPAQPHTRKHTWPLLPLPLLPTSANLSPPLTKYKQNQPPLGMAPQLPAGLHPFRLPCQRSHWTLRLQGKPLAPRGLRPLPDIPRLRRPVPLSSGGLHLTVPGILGASRQCHLCVPSADLRSPTFLHSF